MIRLSRRYRRVGPAPDAEDHGGPRGQVIQIAQDRLLGGTCVLKMAPADSPLADELWAEGELLGDLSHEHLVVLVDHFRGARGLPPGDAPVTGLATRWVDGLPLTQALAGHDRPGRLAAFGQLLDVVRYLHQRGVLHLDLKPDNVILAPSGVVLIDLGSARPLDSGPGEAGGTLGYAAPEVLAGQAASVAADVFSLGAVFYELLTGVSPFGGLTGVELRRAVLAGEVVPVRVVAPGVPYKLAQLAESMLRGDPSRRPQDISQVMDTLSGLGLVIPSSIGGPPFVGRASARAALGAQMLRKDGGVIGVVGEPGSGRTRLVRRAFRDLSAQGAGPWLDLTRTDDPVHAIEGIAVAMGGDLPSRAHMDVWLSAMQRAFGHGWDDPWTIFVGRREAMAPDLVRLIDALSPILVRAQHRVVWATHERLPRAANIALSPLQLSEITDIGRFFGVISRSRLVELVGRTGGWPDALVRLLAPRDAGQMLLADGATRRALGVLAALPPGIPLVVIEALPAGLHQAVDALIRVGAAHWAADGRLYVEHGQDRTPEYPAALVKALRVLASGPAGASSAAWFGLAAARMGDQATARDRFDHVVGGPIANRSVFQELATRLAEGGYRPAITTLAELHEESGDMASAIALWRSLPDRSPQDDVKLVRVLRRAGHLQQAEDHVRACLTDDSPGDLWLELGWLELAAGRLDEARGACDKAESLTPSLVQGQGLSLRVQIAVRRVAVHQPDADTLALLTRVERLAGGGRLPAITMSAAGRLLSELGELRRADRLLAAAAERADQDGDIRRAAGIRLNRGNALQRLGEGGKARRAYDEALVFAERIGAADLVLRLRYSLADLELRAGRLPAAETQIVAFQVYADRSRDDETLARLAELRARLLMSRGRPEEALSCMAAISPDRMRSSLRVSRDIVIARALLELGRASEVVAVLAHTPDAREPSVQALLQTLRARAHLAMARDHLGRARRVVPDHPDPIERFEIGEVLLASAGEDLDPSTFAQRRVDLDRAATLLRGSAAARAATLRDRLLDGPGAALEGIVALAESMNDPQAFPAAVARLVGEALGANRVLITVGIPGLGRQTTWNELGESEAAGIMDEVLSRLHSGDDYWLTNNAFADPKLRESSKTVRTFQLKSLLAVAIPRGDEACGALYVDDLHRASRFGPDDVAMLKRFARAVGDMLPLLSVGERGRALAQPTDLMGVMLADPDDIADMEWVLSTVSAERPANVLVTGETGVGKSWFARRLAIEHLGLNGIETVVLRRGDPQMLVAQLSGAQKGEFTGALDREGAIERCLRLGRALFLDEVQNLDPTLQQILLPLLELPDRHFGGLLSTSHRLGGTLHIILGTNADVRHGHWQEHFRSDLWYRMSQAHVHLPPLADRGAEVVYRYLARQLESLGAPAPEDFIETRALHRVTTWSWPGNLRQLRGFAQKAFGRHRTTGLRLDLNDIERCGVPRSSQMGHSLAQVTTLDAAMTEHVMAVLTQADFVQKRAARELDMSPSALHKFLKRHKLLDEVKRRRLAHRG